MSESAETITRAESSEWAAATASHAARAQGRCIDGRKAVEKRDHHLGIPLDGSRDVPCAGQVVIQIRYSSAFLAFWQVLDDRRSEGPQAAPPRRARCGTLFVDEAREEIHACSTTRWHVSACQVG